MSTPDAYSSALGQWERRQEHHPVCEDRTSGWYECPGSTYISPISGKTHVQQPHVFRASKNWCYEDVTPAHRFDGCICEYINEGEWEL